MQDITTPQFITVSVPGGLHDPSRTIEAVWNRGLGRYTATSVTVARPMAPVVTDDLSASAVRRNIAAGVRTQLLEANPELAAQRIFQTWVDPDRKSRPIRAKFAAEPTDDLLHTASLIVRLERIAGGFPVRTLQRCLGIEHADAKRWMGRLKRKELI